MRSARVLAVLLLLAISSTALAATKAFKFGKLVDGTGRVFTNAVVIVEDERVQSVASGNASIPSGAEVIDLSRYIIADGVDAVIHAVRQVIASGADWVKMYGSTGSFEDVTEFQTFTFEEMKAAVDATHTLGKKIAIHSYGPVGARDAVRAGVDSLEHATDMDDQTKALKAATTEPAACLEWRRASVPWRQGSTPTSLPSKATR